MSQSLVTLEQIRAEFDANDVRGWLWSWLQEVLVSFASRRIKGRYRPQTYSRSQEWSEESIGDLANEFIVRKGIEKGVILKALLVTTDERSFQAYITTSFTRFVITERPRTLARNLFDRLRDVLDAHPDFMRLAGLPPHSQYGLAEWEDDPPQPASTEILNHASRFIPSDIKWVNYDTGTRESPGLSSENLARIAKSLLSGVHRLLTAKQMMDLIGQRYDLGDKTLADDQLDANALRVHTENPLEHVEAEDLANRAFNALTDRQREIIRLMLSDSSVVSARDLAGRLGISKSTAATELRSIQGQFRLLGANSENVQQQVLNVFDELFKAG